MEVDGPALRNATLRSLPDLSLPTYRHPAEAPKLIEMSRLRLMLLARLLRMYRRCVYVADDLRLPLRPFHGLRGVHARAHARGLRRDRLHGQGSRARAGRSRQARDQ